MPSLHDQSGHSDAAEVGTIEPVNLAPPAIERVAEAGTSSSKRLESDLIDALDTIRHVRNALQAAERLDYEHEAEEAEAVRRAADAALCHVATLTSAALDASHKADEQLADVLESAGWPRRALFNRRRSDLPF